ncbi:hypothetical protein OUZ56_003206 [Daphnia magna]|uniref:Uncharacterized protein n=1 Tax=Daphnia magna TaxID=35525 RepID=A0ABR0A823_9CRUS|nr:hypothetical protein OUZ56_003206 [Daphnia magna]
MNTNGLLVKYHIKAFFNGNSRNFSATLNTNTSVFTLNKKYKLIIPDRNCCPIWASKPYQWHRCDEFIQYMFQSNPFKNERGKICSLPFTTELSLSSLDGLYLLIELITKYEYHRWKDGVCEVHKSMTRDAGESKIKNCHCPRYAFKNNEDEKINGEDELRQVDSDY